MTVYEVGFKLQHDCPFNNLSKKYPGIEISQWSNYENDVFEISCENFNAFGDLDKSIRALTKKLGVRILRKVLSGTSEHLVLEHSSNHFKSTCPIIEKNHCLEIQPTIYKEGWERYRIIAFSVKDSADLFRDLDKLTKVEITFRAVKSNDSVRDTFVISTTSLFGKLTTKQTRALEMALENGYYRVPTKITTREIAEKLGLPRTTYEERLRRAESNVLGAIAPYMQLRIQENRN